MQVETRIRLDRFKPRSYQIPVINSLEKENKKRLLLIWPRRAGKDVLAYNILIRAALKKVGVYYYLFPTYQQARKVVWDSVTADSKKFLEYLPTELIANLNNTEMKIKLTNGSIIQLVGSDNYDSLMGTGPSGCIFSEYALQDPNAYHFLRPALTYTDGFALFVSTPRGKNHLWELYNIARDNPDAWYCSKLTVEDTEHISLHDIERERQELSEDLIQQEYYCSFEMGVEGAYYSKYLDRMRLKGQIGQVPHEVSAKVHTAWDIGTRDSTAIIFFQTIGQTIRVIDYYEKSKEGLEHYVNVINSKGYTYGRHFGPHDISVMEFGSGLTRIEKARQLGIQFQIAPDINVADGIEAVRSSFSKMWIDEVKCAQLIKCLENYRQEFDIKRKVYKPQPLHNWASHGADSMRYLAVSLPKTQDGLTPKDVEKLKNEALNPQHNIPRFFRDEQ